MTGAPNPGLSCPEGHFLCYSDLPQVLTELAHDISLIIFINFLS